VDFVKPAERGRHSTWRRTRAGAAYSALIGWGAARPVPERLRPFAYRAFARAVGANLEETELALDAYPSFGDFFARRLREGARVVDPTTSVITAPCDGVVAACGRAVDGVLVQAKGHTYTLGELLADEDYARGFVGGEYATIYLSPRDYHRVHTPVAGSLVAYDYLPGALWPVNPRVASRRAGLFARNERVVIRMNSAAVGDVAVVMVGAAGVGNIALHHGPTSASLRSAGERRRVELRDITLARGDELGAFRLGSTVVLVFQPGTLALQLEQGQTVRFGEPIGREARA
jgi:phosphatidylserine decarboxylase